MKLFLVAGARPNFMKIAPLVHELRRNARGFEWKVVHTGQHYDYEMSQVFFEELDLDKPDYFLSGGGGTQAEQTAKILVEFEKVCLEEKPDMVIVVGDVNSTLAAAITAKKLNIKVAHVEAGLRSGDMKMPEEINRILTDAISDYLFVTEENGILNLKKEGKDEKKVFFVGNVMIDTLLYGIKKLDAEKRKGGYAAPYGVVTLHRPSNVDDPEKLKSILTALSQISWEMPLYFPVHPRTAKNIEKFGLGDLLNQPGIQILPPLSYLDFLALWRKAALVLTDSGGIQEETTVLNIPCFTIRENTERPITIEKGTNELVGAAKESILAAYKRFKEGFRKKAQPGELWDGKTSARILDILKSPY